MTNYNLQRFLDAQESSGFGSYKQAVNEIQKGKKLSHWIWYVFPTLRQNGQDSINEKKYGLVNFEEAKAYYGHSKLRERLENVSDLLLQSEMKSIGEIFGVTDSTRVKSCMTLFYIVSKNTLFLNVLKKYFHARPCQQTLFALNMSAQDWQVIASQSIQKQEISERSYRQSSKEVKASKKHHLNYAKVFVGLFVFLILLASGYWGLQFIKQNLEQNPIVENIEKSNIPVSLILTTADDVPLTTTDLKRFSIRLETVKGQASLKLDTVGNKPIEVWTSDNIEDLKVIVKVEGCTVGNKTIKQDGKIMISDDAKVFAKLQVYYSDLCIFEELAWYSSVKRKIAEQKYPRYIERINKVHNKSFKNFLLAKLKVIGKD